MLGLIFLRFADAKFTRRRAELGTADTGLRGSLVDDPAAYDAAGVLRLPDEARYDELLACSEGGRGGKSLGRAIDDATVTL